MSDPSRESSDRLDSWKAIAAYLHRDERTVRRWEREQGLPVRRMPGGRGASVFAYASEIDDWLKAASAPADPDKLGRIEVRSAATPAWRKSVALVALALLIAAAVALAWRSRGPALTPETLRLEASPTGIVAYDPSGAIRWRHDFPATHKTVLADGDGDAVQVVGGADPGVLFATSFSARNGSDGLHQSGTLTSLSIDGTPRRTFAFTETVTFKGTSYGPPWAITAFAVDPADGERRVAVAAHHFLWSASLVTVLDRSWQRHGTFAHWGWVESVRWIAPNRLLVGGFSTAHDGGMVALLDPALLDGQGPEPPGSAYHCPTCGSGAPVRMVVMPRTELNRVTVSRFNRAVVQVTPDRIVARPIEVPGADQEAVDVVYEFTHELDLVRSSFSARYWELHRALEAQGKLDHPRERCPDRDGPREIQVWDASGGWRMLPARN